MQIYRRFLRQPILSWGASGAEAAVRLPGDRVVPEFQHPEVGDGFGFGASRMSYAIIEPEHVLSIRSSDGNWVW